MTIDKIGQGTVAYSTAAISNSFTSPYPAEVEGTAYTITASPAAGWRFVKWEFSQHIVSTGWRRDGGDAVDGTFTGESQDNPASSGIDSSTMTVDTGRVSLFEGQAWDDFWAHLETMQRRRSLFGPLTATAVFERIIPPPGPILRAASGTILRAASGTILRQGR